MAFLKFNRNEEAEADYLGVQYMYKTGYDPTAFVDFFEDQLVSKGYDWKALLNEFLFEGKEPLINGLVSGRKSCFCQQCSPHRR